MQPVRIYYIVNDIIGNNDDELKKSKLPEKEEKLNIWQKIKNALKKRD